MRISNKAVGRRLELVCQYGLATQFVVAGKDKRGGTPRIKQRLCGVESGGGDARCDSAYPGYPPDPEPRLSVEAKIPPANPISLHCDFVFDRVVVFPFPGPFTIDIVRDNFVRHEVWHVRSKLQVYLSRMFQNRILAQKRMLRAPIRSNRCIRLIMNERSIPGKPCHAIG